MNTYIKKAKALLESSTALEDFLDCSYDFCVKRKNINEEDIRQHMQELDAAIENLPFPQKNAIGCACYALCGAYEYAAFTDGFQKGAGLILNLLENR